MKKILICFALSVFSAGCMPVGFGLSPSNASTGLQILPSSTTVGTNQNLSFQVSGGTTPYQYQVTGVGTIDGSGNYQTGPSTGQGQILVTDANGYTGSASVSVVQYTTTAAPTSYEQAPESRQGLGWSPVNAADLKSSPLVRGQVVAVDHRTLDPQGDAVNSKFIRTNLPHSLVREDDLVEGGGEGRTVVAVRAVIEDQFVVTLRPGNSESRLQSVVALDGAHVSKRLSAEGSFLVTLNKSGKTDKAAPSSDFIAHRALLKRDLQGIALVTPNFISRAPASEPAGQRP